jgi:hypothetical protein
MDLIEVDVIRVEPIKNAPLVASASRGTNFMPYTDLRQWEGNKKPADAAMRDTSHAT